MSQHKVQAIIAAAGTGTRLKSRVAKPFVLFKGKPLLCYCLAVFEKSSLLDSVIIVAHPSRLEDIQRLVKKFRFKKVVEVIAGELLQMLKLGLFAAGELGRQRRALLGGNLLQLIIRLGVVGDHPLRELLHSWIGRFLLRQLAQLGHGGPGHHAGVLLGSRLPRLAGAADSRSRLPRRLLRSVVRSR